MSLREAAQQALEALEIAPLDHNSIKSRFFEHRHHAIIALRDALGADTRTCTCHPGDSPPNPCQRKYALSECLDAALAEDAMQRLTDVQQEMEATSQESRQVEPVAYVTGFSKGYATVRPIDPCLLMCVGMALYRSPPTISKTETVEPVGEIILQDTKYHGRAMAVKPCGKNGVLPEGTKLYTAPPQRTPLTNQEIMREYAALWRFLQSEYHVLAQDILKFTRAIERAHGIGGEE